ncbi:MAG: radical SAM protein [archaeon]
MARVLLIEPHDDLKNNEFRRERINTPINLVYLGTAIEDKHEVKIYDRNIYPHDEDYTKLLKEYKPDIIGLTSMTTPMLHDVMHLGKLTQSVLEGAIIVVGGIHASVDPDSVLKEPYIDYIIRGEGEEAFLEFCDTFDKNPKKLGKLKNVNKNPLRPFIDVAKLKLPNYDLLELKKYGHIYVVLSRGCSGNCTFCCSTRSWGVNGKPCVRSYTSEQMIEFFRKLIEKYKIKTFSIADDNFLSNREQTIEVCKYLKNKGVHFFCFARADDLDNEVLKVLKDAGCHTIQIGIESGSQRVLNFLNKRTTIQQNIDAVKKCMRHGITCDASFMVGLPTETVEEINMTLNFVKKYKPDLPNAKIYLPLPGAPLFDYCVSRSLITKPETLEEWVKWTGNTLKIEVKHKVSEIPDEHIIRTIQKIISTGFHRNKIKRLRYWLNVGDYRHILKSAKRFLIWRDGVVLPFIGMRNFKNS